MIDVHTVGAGGGSIAYVDAGGAFRVGPRSAGAEPGPACYGRGGEEATVTDANVVLGRLRPGVLPRRRDEDRACARDRGGRAAQRPARARHPRGRRGRDHARQPQHGERDPLADDPEGARPPAVHARRLRRRRAAPRGRGGPLARHPAGAGSGLPRAHVGDRAPLHRPEVRPDPERVHARPRGRPGQAQRGLRAPRRRGPRAAAPRRRRGGAHHARSCGRRPLRRPGVRASGADAVGDARRGGA